MLHRLGWDKAYGLRLYRLTLYGSKVGGGAGGAGGPTKLYTPLRVVNNKSEVLKGVSHLIFFVLENSGTTERLEIMKSFDFCYGNKIILKDF